VLIGSVSLLFSYFSSSLYLSLEVTCANINWKRTLLFLFKGSSVTRNWKGVHYFTHLRDL
jgi:hypothetical protein